MYFGYHRVSIPTHYLEYSCTQQQMLVGCYNDSKNSIEYLVPAKHCTQCSVYFSFSVATLWG